MSNIDVLLVTALKEEHDAAHDVALLKAGNGSGVANWEERDRDTTPYLFGKYVGSEGRGFNVALARPTRMATRKTLPVVSTLIERLKPRCVAMCGVCAGNPGSVALGDVIIAEMTYAYDEGSIIGNGDFIGDHRQYSMEETWVRSAQEMLADGLPSYGPATQEEARIWILERLLAGDDPANHHAWPRYFPQKSWKDQIKSLEADGLVAFVDDTLALTEQGKSKIKRIQYLDRDPPEKLPFRIRVGPIATGTVVVKDGLTWEKLKRWGVRSVLGLEMEAAAIATAAHDVKVPNWIVVKGVMDHADPKKQDRYKPFAARASAEVLFRFLQEKFVTVENENEASVKTASSKEHRIRSAPP